jgi:hypothetical protein
MYFNDIISDHKLLLLLIKCVLNLGIFCIVIATIFFVTNLQPRCILLLLVSATATRSFVKQLKKSECYTSKKRKLQYATMLHLTLLAIIKIKTKPATSHNPRRHKFNMTHSRSIQASSSSVPLSTKP